MYFLVRIARLYSSIEGILNLCKVPSINPMAALNAHFSMTVSLRFARQFSFMCCFLVYAENEFSEVIN